MGTYDADIEIGSGVPYLSVCMGDVVGVACMHSVHLLLHLPHDV